jgi:hypothetical protein
MIESVVFSSRSNCSGWLLFAALLPLPDTARPFGIPAQKLNGQIRVRAGVKSEIGVE